VLRVLRDGAFAAAALSAELERATELEERDPEATSWLTRKTITMYRGTEDGKERDCVVEAPAAIQARRSVAD